MDDVFEDSAATNSLKEKRMLSYSLDEPVSFGIAAKKVAQQDLKVNSLRKANSYKESLSKKEIKDLNSLLTAFDLEKVDCSSESDEEQKINKKKKGKILWPIFRSTYITIMSKPWKICHLADYFLLEYWHENFNLFSAFAKLMN